MMCGASVASRREKRVMRAKELKRDAVVESERVEGECMCVEEWWGDVGLVSWSVKGVCFGSDYPSRV